MGANKWVLKILIVYIFVKLLLFMPLIIAAIIARYTDKDSS